MSVLVTVRVRGDVDQFRRVLKDEPERFREIAPEAKAAGAIHHRFGIGDGFVLAVDEWESAEAFQAFFQSSEKVAAIIRDAGGSPEPPEIVITEAINSPDEF